MRCFDGTEAVVPDQDLFWLSIGRFESHRGNGHSGFNLKKRVLDKHFRNNAKLLRQFVIY